MSDSRDNSSFLVQQFLVPLGSLIVGGGLLVWIADLFQASTPTLRAFGEALGAITALSAAFAAGYSIQRIWPWTYSAGRILWILPAFFLLLILVIELIRRHAVSNIVAEYFYPRPGEEDLGVIFFTWPTVSCCLYSLGMVAAHRHCARLQRGSAPLG
jgi:hypothetical protein